MPPLLFTWNGEAMEIAPRFAKEADRRFVIGETYLLDEASERSAATHSHYFAILHDVWLTLPEGIERQFPTVEHLRKFALVKAGFCDHHTIVAASEEEAQKIAGFVRVLDTFAVVVVNGYVVDVFRAQSQSRKAMDARRFQASKEAVLAVVNDLLGVPSGAAERAIL
jgi:hypothetical protein